MKKLTRIISVSLAALTVASTMAIASVAVSAASLKKPTNVKTANGEKTITVSWKKVKGAKKYKVYKGKKLIRTTAKTSIKDTSVYSGKKYTYKVKAVNGKKVSKASKSVTITRINYTIIKTVKNGDGSVTLTWAKRKGANQYKVYRKTSGSYTLLKKVTNDSYTDKNVVSGTKYKYMVVCYNTTTKTKSMNCTARSITYLDKVTGVYARENTDGKSIGVKWNAVSGASSYTVYRRKAAEDSYTKLATTTSTAYKDTKLSNNPTAYMYNIVAVKDSSNSVDCQLAPVAPFLPKRDGVNSYYFDDKNNIHVIVMLNKGDTYAEGKALSDFFGLNGLYTAEVVEGKDVITLTDSVITAANSGKAVIEIKLSDSVADIVNAIGGGKIHKQYERALTKTAYVEVEVA